jgi:hypothetical protein
MTTKTSKLIHTKKRILSVTIRRMIDDSPDSSYLGEYGSQPKSDYAIDRAHSEDCIENDSTQKDKLGRIADAIENDRPVCDDDLDVVNPDCAACMEEKAYTDAMDAVRELAECDCGFSGHWSAREYRYFNPNHENYKGPPENEIRKYCRQDFDRMESLNAGDWCYIGIRAEARVIVNEKIIGPVASHGIAQTITSGGLWGVESDSGREHLEETIREELASLKTELTALGFSKRAIASAFKPENIKEKND